MGEYYYRSSMVIFKADDNIKKPRLRGLKLLEPWGLARGGQNSFRLSRIRWDGG